MKKSRDIVITGIQPWDIGIGSNCINIAKEMAKNHRVLYVNPPLDRKSVFSDRENEKVQIRIECIKGYRNPIQKIHDNLYVLNPPMIAESINWMPHFLFKFWNKKTSKKFATTIQQAIHRIGMKNFLLFTDSDMFRSFYLKDELNPISFIYYSRDNLMTVPYWLKHGQYVEPKIMQKADLVVANSPYLASIASKYNENSHYVGQGCDVESFINAVPEINLQNDQESERKRIGYVGLLSKRRLSITTIEYIAKSRKDWDIILVGPEEECFAKSSLHQLPNIYFVGSVKEKEIGNYVSSFDVCINPQVVNELTKGNYPRKIDEYLSTGRPVVATYTPTMEVFKDFCYLANNDDDYVRLIDQAIVEDSTTKASERIAYAKTHSWANSVNAIWDAFNSTQLVNL